MCVSVSVSVCVCDFSLVCIAGVKGTLTQMTMKIAHLYVTDLMIILTGFLTLIVMLIKLYVPSLSAISFRLMAVCFHCPHMHLLLQK